MDINLISFEAFALESSGAQAVKGASQTLTLQLSLGASQGFSEPMTGIAFLSAAEMPEPLRAAVLPADATPLTITFPVQASI